MKALILTTLVTLASEWAKMVAEKVLMIEEESNMEKKVYKVFSEVCNTLVAFNISIVAGILLFLLKIYS